MFNDKYIVGITGGIASGKSTFSNHIISIGGLVIDADIVAKEVLNYKVVAMKVIDSLGLEVADNMGGIDRGALRKKIFEDDNSNKNRELLNQIMWPSVIKNIKQEIKLLKTNIIFLDVVFLIESGLYDITDCLVVVKAPLNKRLQWLQARAGISKTLAEQIIRTQITDIERDKYADIIVNNSSDIENIKNCAERIYNGFKVDKGIIAYHCGASNDSIFYCNRFKNCIPQ